jgi:F-type H+-transporting ATPase subunit b
MAQPNPLTTPPPGADTQIVPGHTEHTEAHTGAFPPFETSGFLAQLIWLALAFGLLYYLMDKIALPRIQRPRCGTPRARRATSRRPPGTTWPPRPR